MKDNCVRYQPEEILVIIQSDYKQRQQVDFVVLKGQVIDFNTTILEWRDICDLKEKNELWEYLNDLFTLNISKQDWLNVLEPEDDKTIRDLCNFISLHATKKLIQPVKLFGNSCETAAIFKLLISRLKHRGVDVSAIRPSSNLETLFNRFGWGLLQEINLIDPMVLPPINYQSNFIYKWGLRLFITSIIVTICILYKQNLWTVILAGIALISYLMLRIGANLKPKKFNFPGLNTLADVIRQMDIHRFNEPGV